MLGVSTGTAATAAPQKGTRAGPAVPPGPSLPGAAFASSQRQGLYPIPPAAFQARRPAPASKPPRLPNPLVGRADFVGALGGHFHHFLRQALGHQFVRVMLAHQTPVGFFDLGIARLG